MRILSLLLCLCLSFPLAARKSGVRGAFEAGDNTLGFALSLGPTWDYDYAHNYPGFSIIYDHGIISNVGPGTIGIGGMLSYEGAHYDYGGGYHATWVNFVGGVRGTYHLTILKNKNNHFDPYGGILLGFRSVSYDDDYPGYHEGYGGVYPVVGPFVGAKYNFTPNFGAFAEAGFAAYMLQLGLHLNF